MQMCQTVLGKRGRGGDGAVSSLFAALVCGLCVYALDNLSEVPPLVPPCGNVRLNLRNELHLLTFTNRQILQTLGK